jgi:hypothetical protein
MPSFLRNTSGGKAISGGALSPRNRRGDTNPVASYWAGGSVGPAEKLLVQYGLQGAGGGTQACPGDAYFSSGAASGVWRSGSDIFNTSGTSLPIVIGAGGTGAGTGNSTTYNSITATGGNGANRVVCGASNADFSGDCSRLGGDFVCGGSGTRLDAGQGYGGGAGSHANACTNGSGGIGQFEAFTGNGTGIGGGGAVAPASGANMNAAVQYGGGQGTYGGGCQTAPANRGGGASGGGAISTCNQGNGGSGVAYLRYETALAEGLKITGGTKSSNGKWTVHTFTSNDTFSIGR